MVANFGEANADCPTATQIGKYDPRYTKRLSECASLSERVAQLAVAHPMVFFALATKYGPLKARQAAVRLTVDGNPLRDICDAIGLPFCLRRIPPEALRRHLPYARWSAAANRHLAVLVPQNPDAITAWLPRIHLAHQYAGEEFAIWLAGQHRLFEARRPISRSAILVLALYSWNSRYAPLPFGVYTVPPWSPDVAIERAATRAAWWAQQLRVICDLGPEGLADPWIDAEQVDGYVISPIVRPDQLLEEAAAMRNCVTTYSYSLAQNECRLFSMTHRGARVATIEIRCAVSRRNYFISQIKGPLNIRCPHETLQIASKWIHRHSSMLPRLPSEQPNPSREQRLNALMAPYLAHHCDYGPKAELITLKSLFSGVNELARLAGRGAVSRRFLQ